MGSMPELVMTAVGQVFDGAKDVTFTAIPPQVPWVTVFGTVGGIVIGAMGLIASIINRMKIQEVHILVNSQFSAYKAQVAELLAFEKQKSRDQGIADTEKIQKNMETK